MRIPQVQITTTDIQMERSITDAKVNISQPQADLKIEQPAATLEIHTTDPQLHIDMDQLWRDLGMKPTGELINEYAEKGRQGALEGISRRVREGRQFLQNAGKDQGRATMQNIAKQNHGPKRAGPYNIKFIPSYNAVKIDATLGEVNIDVQRNDPKIDVKVNKPKIDYTPGSVNGKMVVRPDVDIDVIG